jgi:transposase
VRQERSRPLVIELEAWLREQRTKLSRNNDTTKAINYCLNRWHAVTRFLDDGRLCMSNNAAQRELQAVAVGRRNWTFATDEGGWRAAAVYTLIANAKLNDIDPQAWLADVLPRLPDHPAKHIHELLPEHWIRGRRRFRGRFRDRHRGPKPARHPDGDAPSAGSRRRRKRLLRPWARAF